MKFLLLLFSLTLFSIFGFAQDPCAAITVTGGGGQVTVSGLSGAAIAGVQVFNSSWSSVFNQTYTNPSGTVTVSPLPAGQYFVNVRLYTSAWAVVCEKGANVTVTNNTPPPADTCGGGFQKLFGLPGGNDEGHSMVRSADGGYIVIGQASASGTTNHDGLIMKFNNFGNLLWSKTIGGDKQDYLSRLVATPDGGCLAGGSVNSDGHNSYSGDCWLIRIDGGGNVLWQKRYLSGSTGNILAITPTSDGGFGIAGTVPFSPGVAEAMVMKIDANGNIQWQKIFGTSSSDNATGIIQDNHGGAGLIVVGNYYTGSAYEAVITKLDLNNGSFLWTKAYDFDNRSNWLGKIYQVADGLVYDVINTDGVSSTNATPAILKTDFDGNVIWVKEYRIPNCHDARMTPLPDGGFAIAQGENPVTDASDNFLMRINAAGNIVWTKKYPQPGSQIMWGIASDGNYIAAAGIAASGSFKDMILVKSDLNGKVGNCSSVDVTATTRNSVINPILNFAWTPNNSITLTAANTNFPVMAQAPVETSLCDGCPNITISSVTVNENAGNAVLQVCLSAPASQDLLYAYKTQDGSALSGSDYTGGAGTVIIPAGQTCASISIPILNDAVVEPDESFTVSIGSFVGTVTITDDDQAQSNCSSITITPGSNQIVVTGVTAPVATVQVFNSGWTTVFNQTYTNAPGTVTVNIGPGTYLVKVTFYTSGWSYVCDKSENNVTVVNNCPAGSLCISNTCPSLTVDLNAAYSIANLPAGTVVSWHTGTPATDANRMTDEQARNVSASGTYYAAIYIAGSGCYSATIPVNVTINPCSSAATGGMNAVALANEGQRATGNVMAFPNPFTSSVKVVIDSEKREKAELVVMDVQGRQLKKMAVQLLQGSNTVLLDGLEKLVAGNYFLRVHLGGEVKVVKIMRQ